MIYFMSNQATLWNNNATFKEFKEWADKQDVLQVDTETEGFFNHDNRILLLQIGRKDVQYVFEFASLTKPQLQYINELFTSNRLKIFHNAKFDIKFLWQHGIDIKNIYDTMLAEILLYAGIDESILMEKYRNKHNVDIGEYSGGKWRGWYGLQRCVYSYTGNLLDKSVRGDILTKGITTPVIEYAAKDVMYLEDVMHEQLNKLKRKNLAKDDTQDIHTVLGLENRACIAFAHIEYCGLKLDLDYWKSEIMARCYQDVEDVKQQLDKLVWSDDKFKEYRTVYQDLFTAPTKTVNINWSSPAQKLKFLKSIIPSISDTSERTLSRLKDVHPAIKLLIKYSKTNKLYTAFAQKMPTYVNPKTGRIHPDFWQILSTGRVSCSKPNLQQIPSKGEVGELMRRAFVSQKGNKIVGGDFSGCELRVIAEFSGDPVWVNAFLQDKDLHSELCAKTFDIDISEVKTPTSFKPEIKYRDVQKTINFGLAYGMSEFKLADTMEVSVDKAKSIIDKFFGIVPKVKNYLDGLGQFSVKNNYAVTPLPYQRRRYFLKPKSMKDKGSIERAGKNTPIQGCNADLTKLALVRCYDYIRHKDWWNPVTKVNKCFIIHTVHDEIQTECNEDLAGTWKAKMNEIMETSGKDILKTIPMKVDCSESTYWTK